MAWAPVNAPVEINVSGPERVYGANAAWRTPLIPLIYHEGGSGIHAVNGWGRV
jgi:hypothetical protein